MRIGPSDLSPSQGGREPLKYVDIYSALEEITSLMEKGDFVEAKKKLDAIGNKERSDQLPLEMQLKLVDASRFLNKGNNIEALNKLKEVQVYMAIGIRAIGAVNLFYKEDALQELREIYQKYSSELSPNNQTEFQKAIKLLENNDPRGCINKLKAIADSLLH